MIAGLLDRLPGPGLLLVLLAAFSAAAWALIFERASFLRGRRPAGPDEDPAEGGWLGALERYLACPGREGADALLGKCEREAPSIQRIAHRLVEGVHPSDPPAVRLARAAAAAGHEIGRGLSLIGALLHSTILLGLCAAVGELGRTLRSPAAPTAPPAAGMADALAAALLALAVALPGLAVHAGLVRRAQARRDEVDLAVQAARARGEGAMIARRPALESPGIDFLPLVGLVFLLIAFFLVRLGGSPEAKVGMLRPASAPPPSSAERIVIAVTAAGTVNIDGTRVDLALLRPSISRRIQSRPRSEVLVVADEAARATLIARVVNECRLAGAADVGFALRAEGAVHDAAARS